MITRTKTLTSFLSLTCGLFSSSIALASSDDAPTTYIANGETVGECGFAPVLFIDNCTAALVHPKLVLYAAHCGKNHPQVHFTHQQRAGRSVRTKYCKTHPKYSGYQGYDFAFCVLEEEITDIPYVPVAFGCETDDLGPGTDIVQCGFGSKVGKSTGFGTKRWGSNTIAKIVEKGEHGTVTTSPSKVVGCPGDSGGPLLTQLKDGTWRTLGMASTIDTGYQSCGKPGAVNTYANSESSVAWVEKESGIDITPCFESDGTWAPTEACGKFYMGSAKGYGSWSDGCKGTPVSGYSATCGEPFGGKNKAPEVVIEPLDGDKQIVEGDSLSVEVKASDDGEIAKVELQVNGKTLESLSSAPYRFELEDLKLGSHKLVALATDDKELKSESEPVAVKVQKKEEEKSSDDKSNDDKSNDDKSNDDKSNDDKSSDDKSNDDKSKGSESEDGSSAGSSKKKKGNTSKEKEGCRIDPEGGQQPWLWSLMAITLWGLRSRKRS